MKDQKDNIEHLWHRARRSRAHSNQCIIHLRPAAHCAWRANTPPSAIGRLFRFFSRYFSLEKKRKVAADAAM
jgi:hypothetical protein